MTDDQVTLQGLRDYYRHRRVFARGEVPSIEDLTRAVGQCQTMIGQLIRLLEERDAAERTRLYNTFGES